MSGMWNNSKSKGLKVGALVLQQLEARVLMSAVNVTTFHNDIGASGANLQETTLSPANVNVSSFGKLYTVPLDGNVYTQPLVLTQNIIAAGPNTTAGAAGLHDVVFAATEHDSLYAIDSATGTVLWKRSFLDTTSPGVGLTPGSDINNTLSATSITAVPYADVGIADISPEVGITGTPVIDAAAGRIYLVVKTKETINGVSHYVQRVHAINTSDGTDAVAPYLIGDTYNNNVNNTAVYSYGTGTGAVTDPYNGTGNKVVQFNALRENQRCALSLVNGTLFVEFAGHGDMAPYHGWVTAWDVSHLATTGFVLKGVFNASPNGGGAGIWGGGGSLTFESDGSAFYLETGNGVAGLGNVPLNAAGFPSNGSYYEALVKLTLDTTTSPTNQNQNGWGIKPLDFFMPYNQAALDNVDADFGSGSPLILPDAAGIPGHQHLLLASGKQGVIYVVDRDNMGKFDPTADHVVNAVPDASGHVTPPLNLSGSLSTPVYYNGTIYWVSGYTGPLKSFNVASDGTLVTTSQSALGSFGSLPGSPALSAYGNVNGVLWVTDRARNQLHAYDASSMSTELWNSGQKAGGLDSVGAIVKMAAPTVANGQVYVGTTNSLVVYGLVPPATSVPVPPVLTASPISGTSINLTWTDTSVLPNTASSYAIEELINGNYTQITTAPGGTSSLSIGGLSPLTAYSFRIRGVNGVGNSGYSNVAQTSTSNQVAALDYSAGFGGSTSSLTYNGSAAIVSANAELTNGSVNQTGSLFSTSPVDITKFSTSFNFHTTAGDATGDGFTFAVQGVWPIAQGAGGGSLGYGTNGIIPGIPNSVAVKFDLYNNAGEGSNSTGLYTNGVQPMNPTIDLTPSGINLHSGDVFKVDLNYDGAILTENITDIATNKVFSKSYVINIPGAVGGNSAFVGFTAASGGATSTQDIQALDLLPRRPASPRRPHRTWRRRRHRHKHQPQLDQQRHQSGRLHAGSSHRQRIHHKLRHPKSPRKPL